MRRLYAGLVLFLYYFSATAQTTFTQIPNDLQLFPRDASNQASVVISGTTGPGFVKIKVQQLRQGILTGVSTQTLSPGALSSPFSFTNTIKAERAEYTFRVFIFNATDSALIAERKRIVCGDVYIIHGQSNALALAGFETDQVYGNSFDDTYMRTCAYVDQANPGGSIAWYPAKQPFGVVGGLGLTIQRLILQTYGIPTCVINGAKGGTSIVPLINRNPANPADVSTIYGSLLFRAQWAGVARQARAILWRQGETDAGEGTPGYGAKFATLYKQLREDYGNARIYVSQINILPGQEDTAASIRNAQRLFKYQFANLENIATVGSPGYDGIHYTPESYQQQAFEQFRQIARDLYGSTDTLQINSPDVKKVFYNARKDTISLVYEDQMQMVWKSDTTFYNFATGEVTAVRRMKDYFYLDTKAGAVASGSASGNRIKLALTQPQTATKLRYLPAYFYDFASDFYNGPTLRNTRGMRAFSFDNVTIADAIVTTALAAKPVSETLIQLSWPTITSAQTIILEKATDSPTNFTTIATLSGTTTTYADQNLPNLYGSYFYRLRAYSSASESTYSNIASAKPLVLALEPTEPPVQLYPNPLLTDRLLTIVPTPYTLTGIALRNELGQVVKTWAGTARTPLTIDLRTLSAGLYVVDMQTTDDRTLRRKLVIR